MSKPRILVLTGFYLPGFKSGGPLRSIANLIELLHEDFEFWVIASDRDLGDGEPYPSIPINSWTQVGHAKVRYLPPSDQKLRAIWGVIAEARYDLIYLNSFFAPWFTIFPLLGRRLGKIPSTPVLLAPRGEFSFGAISLKPFKKRMYIMIARTLALLGKVRWHASSEYERRDIQYHLGISSDDLFVASDLSESTPVEVPAGERTDNEFHLVFLSRIARMKNLHFALEVLKSVRSEIIFNIFGPIEDREYWKLCESKIAALPKNVRVKYHGPVEPAFVRRILRESDLFFLPTLGENYGHVISEALSVGTPILISDQTPWRSSNERGLGRELSLDEPSAFSDYIDEVASMSKEDRNLLRMSVHRAFRNASESRIDLEANRQMFLAAMLQSSP